MTIAPHALVGAALATATTSPTVAFLLGFVSHFLLDAIPHFEPGTLADLSEDSNEWPVWVYVWIFAEIAASVLLIYLLFHQRWDANLIYWGAFGGIFVDLVEHSPLAVLRPLPFFKQLHWLHENLHLEINRKYWYWAIFFTMISIGGPLWYLLKL